MSSALEACLIEISDLKRRIERLEEALAAQSQAAETSANLHWPDAPEAPDVTPATIHAKSRSGNKAPAPPLKLQVQAALEENPRVMHRIRMMWFYPECEQLLDKLIIDDRGNRAGFSRDVMDELLFLASLARSVRMHPGFVKPLSSRRADIWAEQRKQRTEKG